ncbi:MAG: DUF2937 family protein [Pseudomonadales bacterium]|nr:DUF2937 family protein [Pseudomonadales bacterium]
MTFLFTSLFRSYSRLLLFAIGLLLGIQVPSFVHQYQQRIDAHFREVSINIAGFQDTAERLFNGDLEALVAYYQNSNDEVFQSDAVSIRLIVDRYSRIRAEQEALQGNMAAVAWYIIHAADAEFFEEAVSQYSSTVPLNSEAIQWGLALAILSTLAIDVLVYISIRCFRVLRYRRKMIHASQN